MSHTPRSPTSSGSSAPLSPTSSGRAMLVRTSSGNQSVGHLSHSPHGFSKLHRPDVTFSCGSLLFPAHSLLLAVSSRFWTEFFSFIQGQHPEVISLDAVKCEALSAVSLGYYLEYVYSGALPAFDTAADAVELLRLSAFFSNAALISQISTHLAAQIGAMPEEGVLEVFKAAVDLQQRQLVTECVVLLLPQFGRCTTDATVAQVIDLMDATLSKVVLTQLTMSGSPLALQRGGTIGGAITPRASGPRCSSDSDVDLSAADSPNLTGFDFEVSLAPPGMGFDTMSSGQLSPGRAPSSYGGASRRTSFSEAAAVAAADAQVEAMKGRFIEVLADKGWGN